MSYILTRNVYAHLHTCTPAHLHTHTYTHIVLFFLALWRVGLLKFDLNRPRIAHRLGTRSPNTMGQSDQRCSFNL